METHVRTIGSYQDPEYVLGRVLDFAVPALEQELSAPGRPPHDSPAPAADAGTNTRDDVGPGRT